MEVIKMADIKRNKHITINLSDDEYNALLFMANKDRRTLANYLYLLVSDEINNRLPVVACVHTEMKKPTLEINK